jgi:hypothetical protein
MPSCRLRPVCPPNTHLSIRVHRVQLHKLAELVGVLGCQHVEADAHPVVHQRRMLRHKAVKPQQVAAKRLHDLRRVIKGGAGGRGELRARSVERGRT